jgi:N-acetyl-anhydromuramyl-L-alanine amidase AmpD
MSFETDLWRFIPARHFTKVTEKRAVRVIVIHDMEAPENSTTAESVAKWFQTPASKPASAHICVDSDSIVQCVRDNNIAHAAPGANHDGIQIELAGYARQTLREWLDDYSVLTLSRGAHAAAQYCLKYNIPVKHLTNAELRAGQKGIVGHAQVTEVYKRSDHTDPGKNFPWTFFMGATHDYHAARKKPR